MASFNDFGGQWIEIFEAGTRPDSQGVERTFTRDDLRLIAEHYEPSLHESPIVIGHPQLDAPGYGWAEKLRVSGDKLEARFTDVDPDFETAVRDGRFKKRSASFYVDPKTAPAGRAPYLRHVGFLGAQPPAVKGLRDVKFSEGENVTFEFSEDPQMTQITQKGEDPKEVANSIWEHLKKLLPGKKEDAPATAAAFSEADVKRVVEEQVKAAVQTATASFTEQLKERDTKLAALEGQVAAQSSTSVHAANVAFVESLGKAKCPPAFQRMGVVEFMDRLALVPTDQKVVVIEFAEKDGVKTETKTEMLEWFKKFMGAMPAFLSFGEGFGSITATGDAASALIDPQRVAAMRQTVGVKAPEATTNGGGKS